RPLPNSHQILPGKRSYSDTSERRAFLDQACAGDLEMRSIVEALLASDEKIGEFLAGPAIGLMPNHAAADSGEYLSSRIGPYRILREIGHGGMGSLRNATGIL